MTHIKSSLVAFIFTLTASLPAHSASQVETNGDILQVVVPLTGLGVSLFYETNNEGSTQFYKAMGTTLLTTYTLKTITNKRRPDGSCCSSFPSGHTSAAFMGASFIHFRYGLKYAIPAYLAASYVGYSRVYANRHYPEDVLAGATIGILSSYYFTTRYNKVRITPVVDKKTMLLILNYQW